MDNEFQHDMDELLQELELKDLADQIEKEIEEDERRLKDIANELKEQREQERWEEGERIARLQQEIEEDRELKERLNQEQVEREELENERIANEKSPEEQRQDDLRNDDQIQSDARAQEERTDQERLNTETRLEQERNAKYSARDFAQGEKGFKQFIDNKSALRFEKRPRQQRLQEDRGKQLEWHVRYQNSVQRQDLENWKDHDPESHDAYYQARLKQLDDELQSQLEPEIEKVDLDTILAEYDAEREGPPQENPFLVEASKENINNLLKDSVSIVEDDSLLSRDSANGENPSQFIEETKSDATNEQMPSIDFNPSQNEHTDFYDIKKAVVAMEMYFPGLEKAQLKINTHTMKYLAQSAIALQEKHELQKFIDAVEDPYIKTVVLDRLEDVKNDPELLEFTDRLPADYEHPFDESDADLDKNIAITLTDDFAVSINTAENAKFRAKLALGEALNERDLASQEFERIFESNKEHDEFSHILREQLNNAIDEMNERLGSEVLAEELENAIQLERDAYVEEVQLEHESTRNPSLKDLSGLGGQEVLTLDEYMTEARSVEQPELFAELPAAVAAWHYEVLEHATRYIHTDIAIKQNKVELSEFLNSIEDSDLKQAAMARLAEFDNNPELMRAVSSRLLTSGNNQEFHSDKTADEKLVLDKVDDFVAAINQGNYFKTMESIYLNDSIQDREQSLGQLSQIIEDFRDDNPTYEALKENFTNTLQDVQGIVGHEALAKDLEYIATQERQVFGYNSEQLRTERSLEIDSTEPNLGILKVKFEEIAHSLENTANNFDEYLANYINHGLDFQEDNIALTELFESIEDPELEEKAHGRFEELQKNPVLFNAVVAKRTAERPHNPEPQELSPEEQVIEKVEDLALRIKAADDEKLVAEMNLASSTLERREVIGSLSELLGSYRDEPVIERLSQTIEQLRAYPNNHMRYPNHEYGERFGQDHKNVIRETEHALDFTPQPINVDELRNQETADAEEIQSSSSDTEKDVELDFVPKSPQMEAVRPESFNDTVQRYVEEHWHEHWLASDDFSQQEIEIGRENDGVSELFGLDQKEVAIERTIDEPHDLTKYNNYKMSHSQERDDEHWNR